MYTCVAKWGCEVTGPRLTCRHTAARSERVGRRKKTWVREEKEKIETSISPRPDEAESRREWCLGRWIYKSANYDKLKIWELHGRHGSNSVETRNGHVLNGGNDGGWYNFRKRKLFQIRHLLDAIITYGVLWHLIWQKFRIYIGLNDGK